MTNNVVVKLMQLSKIFKEGFTIQINNGDIRQYNNPNKPYIVSYKTLIEIKNIVNGVIFKEKLIIPDKCIIGAWLDIDTNTYYIELNKAFSNKKYAIKAAKLLDQKAIYDYNKQQVIFL